MPTPTPPPQQPVPTPPRVDQAAEKAAIQQLLARYVAAYNALDERQLRAIDPNFTGIPNKSLVLKSLELQVSIVSIDVSPDGQAGLSQRLLFLTSGIALVSRLLAPAR